MNLRCRNSCGKFTRKELRIKKLSFNFYWVMCILTKAQKYTDYSVFSHITKQALEWG